MSFGFGLGFPRSVSSAGGPTLNFQFVGSTMLDPLITFTRASTATFFNSSGVLTSAAIDAPRFDYNPSTLAAQGLLIEEARTNSIRNNTMVGAVAGTPGTLPTNWAVTAPAANVIGTGTENGITYIDVQIVGTTGATTGNVAFDTITAIAAASGQTWTNSVYIRLVAGSFTNVTQVRVNMQGYTSASAANADAFSSSDIISSLSATNIANNRRTLTATLADATTAYIRPRLFINWTNGSAVDFTLRIGLPQLEQGAFATSVIPTTTTALTRSADVASVNTLAPWFNQTEGTVYAEFQSLSPLTSAQSVALGKYPHVWHIEAGASDSNVFWYGLGAEAYISTTYNNIGIVPSGINKFALSLAPSGGQSRSSLNGAAAVNRNGTLTGTATGFFLGRDSTAGLNSFLNGWLRRLTYYPRALSAAELPVLTA